MADREEDDFIFAERLEELNEELEVLNSEASELEERICEQRHQVVGGGVVSRNYGTMLLGQVATLYDSLHKTPSYADEGISMVRATDIRRGFVDLSGTKKVDVATFEEYTKKYEPRIGDTLFTRVGANYGESGFVNKRSQFCLGQNTVCITPKTNSVSPFYLYCCLNSPQIRGQIDSFVGGGAQPTISLKNIRLIEIPCPPLPTQHEIASILSAYDDLIENNTRRIAILEEMAQAMYREWFVNFRFPGHENVKLVDSPLGQIPEGWEVKPVSEVFETLGGGTPSKKVDEYWDGGDITWFAPSDLTKSGNMYSASSGACITEAGLKKSSAKLFPAYSVMLTSRATIGVLSINTVPASTNQGSLPVSRTNVFRLCSFSSGCESKPRRF